MLLSAFTILVLLQSSAPAGPNTPVGMAEGTELVSLSSSDHQGQWSISVYVRPDYRRPEPGQRFQPLFFTHFSRGQESDGQLREVRWADSRSCPKLFGVLEAVANLTAPRFDMGHLYGIPPVGTEAPPPRPVPTDAVGAEIRGRARQPDGSLAYMSLSDAQGPVTDVALFSHTQLESCWSESRPDFLESNPANH